MSALLPGPVHTTARGVGTPGWPPLKVRHALRHSREQTLAFRIWQESEITVNDLTTLNESHSASAALRSLDLLSALDQRQIDTLAAHIHRRELRRGEHLFHAGTPAESFFVLRTGQVKLFVLSHQGEEKVLGLVEAGETFAEGVTFMEEPSYPVSAQALTACEVWAISASALRQLLSHSFPTCLKLLARQTQRIQGLLMEVEAQALESAHHRLIAYLLKQAGEGDAFTLPASKTLIAAHLAIKPETLSRLLSEIQRRGLIEMQERDIRLLDRDALLGLSLEPVLRS